MSYKLWISTRLFPLLPVFDNFNFIKYPLDYLLLTLLIISFIFSGLSKKRVWLSLSFSLLLIFMLQDQMRWQPWVYVYLLVLLPFLVKIKDKQAIINYLQILLVGIYFWSGVHKMNPKFNELIIESIALYLFRISDYSIVSFIKSIGYIFPLFEIVAALFLIIPKTRKIGVYIIILIHLFIIIYLSPLGVDGNYIVYPWNLFMMISTYILFFNNSKKLKLFDKGIKPIILNSTLIIVLLLPFLNFFNKWDTYLSFSLYSGKPNNLYILIKKDYLHDLNAYKYDDYFYDANSIKNGAVIDVDAWSFSELNVPMNPEKRLFKKVAKSFCDSDSKEEKLMFIETDFPLWKNVMNEYYQKKTQKQDSIFFIKFKKPLEVKLVDYFICKDI